MTPLKTTKLHRHPFLLCFDGVVLALIDF